MILTEKIIKKIEGLLEKGYTIELRHEEGDLVPTESGPKPRPQQLTVFKRPDDPNDIYILPTLINQEGRTELAVMALLAGEDPILIAKVVVPPGWHLTGLKGNGGISQEIPDGD